MGREPGWRVILMPAWTKCRASSHMELVRLMRRTLLFFILRLRECGTSPGRCGPRDGSVGRTCRLGRDPPWRHLAWPRIY